MAAARRQISGHGHYVADTLDTPSAGLAEGEPSPVYACIPCSPHVETVAAPPRRLTRMPIVSALEERVPARRRRSTTQVKAPTPSTPLAGVAVEQHGTAPHAVAAVAVVPSANRPTRQRAPDAVDAVDGDRAHGIVDLQLARRRARRRPRARRRSRRSSTATGAVTNAQGAVIATRPASMPFRIMLRSGLPSAQPGRLRSRRCAPPVAGQHGVERDQRDAQVGRPASVLPGLKPNQPKPEDERADERHRDVVAGIGFDLAVLACTCRCGGRG